jgi:predicted SAM-dependent methyltransferase
MKALNIGGGPKFRADGWINLDAVGSKPFILSSDCVLPMADASLDLVYSSHTLEHLDDPTVARVLEESRRVLKKDGKLLIKIPDFDIILEAYRRGDLAFFHRWPNVQTMTEITANRGMSNSIEAIAAQCFCGFWNKEFGHMFDGYDLERPGAYYGPPVMTDEQLRPILAQSSPHAIAATLRAHVIENEKDYLFNHQNAWSRTEFVALLREHGFVVISRDAGWIVAKYRGIPEIGAMLDISAFYRADPVHA